MAPPSYNELGKQARDIFNGGYHFGLFKVSLKTKTASGVEFTSGGTSDHETGKVFGSLETKYKVGDYGLSFCEKWNTDNTLATEVSSQDQIAKGLKVGLDCSFAPQTGNKKGILKTAFLHDSVAVNADVNLNVAGPQINASAVVGYQGFLLGYQTAFDSENSKMTKNNFAVGFTTGDLTLHTNVDNAEDFGGSVYQKVTPKLDTGVQLNWSNSDNATRFGIGCKYTLEHDVCVRMKVNNVSEVGLGYSQKLKDGITLTLSVQIDGKNINNGGHKVGAALELEA